MGVDHVPENTFGAYSVYDINGGKTKPCLHNNMTLFLRNYLARAAHSRLRSFYVLKLTGAPVKCWTIALSTP